MLVTGIVQRGFSAQSAHLIEPLSVTTATTPQRGVIPNFARKVRVLADQNNSVWGNEVVWAWGDGFNIMRGRQMRELMAQGQGYPVVPGAVWTLSSKPAATLVTYPWGSLELDWEIVL